MHVLGFTADEGKWMNGHVLGEFTEAGGRSHGDVSRIAAPDARHGSTRAVGCI